jgi:uncharacterized membrane protein YoaK (UPF0700 family)
MGRVTPARDRVPSELLVGLTAAAGWLDALAFLYLGKVFVAFTSADLLFVGIGAGTSDEGLALRAGLVLSAFAAASAAGGRASPRRTLQLESGLLVAFAVLWVVADGPADDAAVTLVLLALGGAAMGLQASIAFSFHLPNVARVVLTSVLVRPGRRRRRRRPIAGGTPGVSLMILLCIAYLVSAVVVAAVPETPALAFGPLLLVASAVVDARALPRSAR